MNIVWVAVAAFVVNVPLGKWRNKYKKFTIIWWLLIHASIPLIVTMRIWLDTPTVFIPLFILCAISGQLVGSKLLNKEKTS